MKILSQQTLVRVLIGISIAIAVTLFAAFCAIVITFLTKFAGTPLADSPAWWGVVGDYFGGFLNPIVSAATLLVTIYIAVVATIIQRDERKRLSQPFLFVDTRLRDNWLTVRLNNFGVGPATKVKLVIQNEDRMLDRRVSLHTLIDRSGEDPTPWVLDGFRGELPAFLPPGGHFELLVMFPSEKLEAQRSLNTEANVYWKQFKEELKTATQTLSRLRLHVTYCNAFDQPQEPISYSPSTDLD